MTIEISAGGAAYIGLDLGTSGLRALLMSQDGAVIGSADASFSVSHVQPGWSEQDPASWIAACEKVMDALRQDHPDAFKTVAAIAVAGHMHGAVLMDAEGAVLRPCILWNDTRSHEEAAWLDAQENVRALSGNIVFPGFTAPKLLWVAQAEPNIFARTAAVLLPKDYLNYWLTGVLFAEMSDASGTSWLDFGNRCWSDELLTVSKMQKEQMPPLVEGSDAAAQLSQSLQERWGFVRPVTIAGGAADNAAAACGIGALGEGDGFISLGTSGVILAARGAYAPQPETAVHTFCHAVPGRWYQMGVVLAATDSLNWLARQLGKNPAELAALMGDLNGPGSVQFLPYLSGERTPHNDSRIRGAFLNLDISGTPEDLVRAVMEGVCFALRDSFEVLKAAGAQLERLTITGGGSQSDFWTTLCATVLNVPVDLPEGSEFGAALGAARLALCAHSGAPAEEIMTPPKIAKTVMPRSNLIQACENAYQNWRKTYLALKDLHHD